MRGRTSNSTRFSGPNSSTGLVMGFSTASHQVRRRDLSSEGEREEGSVLAAAAAAAALLAAAVLLLPGLEEAVDAVSERS